MSETPRKFAINCPGNCSFHPAKIGNKHAGALRMLKENGAGREVFARRAAEILGHPVHESNVARHLRHYVEVTKDEPEVETGPKPTDLAILDAIITSGYRNSRNWKPTIKDTLDAMKLKVQMTGQSAFEDMLAQMDAALNLADSGEDEMEDVVEAPEALFSAAETPEEEPEDDE